MAESLHSFAEDDVVRTLNAKDLGNMFQRSSTHADLAAHLGREIAQDDGEPPHVGRRTGDYLAVEGALVRGLVVLKEVFKIYGELFDLGLILPDPDGSGFFPMYVGLEGTSAPKILWMLCQTQTLQDGAVAFQFSGFSPIGQNNIINPDSNAAMGQVSNSQRLLDSDVDDMSDLVPCSSPRAYHHGANNDVGDHREEQGGLVTTQEPAQPWNTPPAGQCHRGEAYHWNYIHSVSPGTRCLFDYHGSLSDYGPSQAGGSTTMEDAQMPSDLPIPSQYGSDSVVSIFPHNRTAALSSGILQSSVERQTGSITLHDNTQSSSIQPSQGKSSGKRKRAQGDNGSDLDGKANEPDGINKPRPPPKAVLTKRGKCKTINNVDDLPDHLTADEIHDHYPHRWGRENLLRALAWNTEATLFRRYHQIRDANPHSRLPHMTDVSTIAARRQLAVGNRADANGTSYRVEEDAHNRSQERNLRIRDNGGPVGTGIPGMESPPPAAAVPAHIPTLTSTLQPQTPAFRPTGSIRAPVPGPNAQLQLPRSDGVMPQCYAQASNPGVSNGPQFPGLGNGANGFHPAQLQYMLPITRRAHRHLPGYIGTLPSNDGVQRRTTFNFLTGGWDRVVEVFSYLNTAPPLEIRAPRIVRQSSAYRLEQLQVGVTQVGQKDADDDQADQPAEYKRDREDEGVGHAEPVQVDVAMFGLANGDDLD
ncbi:hypothetical protein H2203_008590 [Taxawa tesnikishii (nom. ined.)]|nr:hypothetical protein H2203_008590 [Dothideales sp. JES 119]